MLSTGVPYPVNEQDYPVTGDPAGFGRWRDRVEVGEVNDGNAFHAFGGVAGHAGLFGTVAALHAVGDWLLAGLAGENAMTAVRRFVVAGPDPGQALGFRLWSSRAGNCRAQVIGHTGFPGIGFGIIPAHRASVVLATNRLHVATGEPIVFAPAWAASLDAAHAAWHANN
jgi:CubicO group peptidase (beta-lactamase class C family)